MLNWHEITPFSRMSAIIVFVGIVPALSFYLGMQYQDMLATKNVMRSYDFPILEHYAGSTAVTPETNIDAATTTP